MNPFYHHNLESDISGLKRDMFTKANTYDLDRANERIRELSNQLEREICNRQSLEFRVEQLERRIEELSAAGMEG